MSLGTFPATISSPLVTGLSGFRIPYIPLRVTLTLYKIKPMAYIEWKVCFLSVKTAKTLDMST